MSFISLKNKFSDIYLSISSLILRQSKQRPTNSGLSFDQTSIPTYFSFGENRAVISSLSNKLIFLIAHINAFFKEIYKSNMRSTNPQS